LSAPPDPIAAVEGCLLLKGREGRGKEVLKKRRGVKRREGEGRIAPTLFLGPAINATFTHIITRSI